MSFWRRSESSPEQDSAVMIFSELLTTSHVLSTLSYYNVTDPRSKVDWFLSLITG